MNRYLPWSSRRVLTALVLAVWLASVQVVSAHSRFQILKVQLTDTLDKQRLDSIKRNLPGVFSVSWFRRRQLLVVVYDRSVTHRESLERSLNFTNVKAERKEKGR